MLLRNTPYIHADLEALLLEPFFVNQNVNIEDIKWCTFPSGFAGFTRVLLGQQVSTLAADRMWERLIQNAGDIEKVTPVWVLEHGHQSLKTFGFSRQKIKYINNLAECILNRSLDIEALVDMSDDKAVNVIKGLLGFGSWSAHLYLMFSLHRRNILPEGDLVLNKAAQQIYGLKTRPDYSELQHLTTPWNGRLTAATLLLWQIYINNEAVS